MLWRQLARVGSTDDGQVRRVVVGGGCTDPSFEKQGGGRSAWVYRIGGTGGDL